MESMAETAQTERVNVLGDAQDITLIKHLGHGNYVYAAKLSLDAQSQFYNLSISDPKDEEVLVFQGYWEFDEEKGIMGPNPWLNLRFDRQALRPSGLWLPGLLEAKSLHNQGKLEEGFLRGYGFVVYSEDNPNIEIARPLIAQAESFGLRPPLIIPFRALDYNIERKEAKPFFIKSPKGMISGEGAEKELNSFCYRGNSGVHGFGLDAYESWTADLVLDYPFNPLLDNCDLDVVDWVCGEASRAKIERAKGLLLERISKEPKKGLPWGP